MNEKLEGLIKEARRDLRRLSGVPLTEEERTEEARHNEIEDLKESLLKTVGLKVALELYFHVIWIDGRAAADIKVDGHTFRIRKAKDLYSVSLVDGSSERELTTIDSKFGRILVLCITMLLLEPGNTFASIRKPRIGLGKLDAALICALNE